MSRIFRKSLLVFFTTLSLVGLTTGAAQAKTVEVTGKQTQLTVKKQVVQFLSQHDVTVSAVAPATLSGRTLTLPISGGYVTRHGRRAQLRHSGALKLTMGSISIELSSVRVQGEHGRVSLTARVGGHRITVAHLTHVRLGHSGREGTLKGEVKLSKTAARRIDDRFGQTLVQAGTDLGSLTSTVTFK